MPRLSFTQNLKRHVDCPELAVSGATLREALEDAFRAHPALRGYILNDQGALHPHVALVVNGCATTDRVALNLPLTEADEVYVMQALSGG